MSTSDCYGGNVFLLVVSGIFVNGPYALITTAVSADLGTHPSLQGIRSQSHTHKHLKQIKITRILYCILFIYQKQGSSKALATVTAIIDGTGSIGAAIGPFLAGALPEGEEGEGKNHELDNIFYMLMAADIVALFVSS